MQNFDEIIPRQNTGCLKYDDLQHRFGNTDIQPMWVADMDLREPEFIRDEFEKIINHGIYGYQIKLPKYYEAIINWYKSRHNYIFDKQGIFFTPGVVPAISYIIQAFTKPGDKIIIQTPVYYPFMWVIKNNNRELVNNQLLEEKGNYSINFEELEQQAKESKMLILCSPHNPVGRVWSKEELEKIVEICIKNNVIIVSDEIHNDIVFEPHKHIPTASISDKSNKITITCHAASKTFNLAGLSAAYIHMIDHEMQNIFKTYYANLFADEINVFGMVATYEAFTKGEPWLNEMKEYVKSNYLYIKNYLVENLPQITVSALEATYLVWFDFRNLKLTNEELKQLIIEKAHLGLNDGPTFGDGGSGFQRMNIACPKSVVEKAMNNIKIAVDSLKVK